MCIAWEMMNSHYTTAIGLHGMAIYPRELRTAGRSVAGLYRHMDDRVSDSAVGVLFVKQA